MMAWIEANAVLATGAALVLLGLIWLLLARRRRPAPKREYRDVLSEGAGPAQRNTALIDAPPAAALVPPVVTDAPLVGDGDDLTRIKGLGPKLSRLLAELGVTRYAQIASWTEADIATIDAKLGAFAGRPTRDAWVEQARLLESGDAAAYEEKFGKL
jgi:predicted flap endonuclease-1-like 5' DNA nuclease